MFLDLFLYAAGIWVVLAAQSMLAKMAVGCSLAIVISRCSSSWGTIACHRSLFTCTWLNRVLGRILFLPSLTPYSLWEVGHNTGFITATTTSRAATRCGLPYSPREFVRLPRYFLPLRPGAHLPLAAGSWPLLCRGAPGGTNYSFPPPPPPIANTWECAAPEYVGGFGAGAGAYLGILLAVCALSAKSFLYGLRFNMLFAVALPLVLWKWIMGFTIYVAPHPSLRPLEFQDRREWSFQRGVESTVHVVFPEWIDFLMHWIYQHPAHHSERSEIVSYRLRAATVGAGVISFRS